jgi:hypothetical protein
MRARSGLDKGATGLGALAVNVGGHGTPFFDET